jgi:hypothetical protein
METQLPSYIWVTTSGDHDVSELKGDYSQEKSWNRFFNSILSWCFTIFRAEITTCIIQIFGPVILYTLLIALSELFPSYKPLIESSGFLPTNIAIITIVFIALLLHIRSLRLNIRRLKSTLQTCQDITKKRQYSIYKKLHNFIHFTRNMLCTVEDKMENIKQEHFSSLLAHVQELKKRQNNKADRYKDKDAFDKKKQEIHQKIEKATNKLVGEAYSFYSNICDKIAKFFESDISDKNSGSCIRIMQTEPDGKGIGYTTFGRSEGIAKDNRMKNTEKIKADEGIAKIISNGVQENSQNCLLIVPSIKHAIKNKDWKETKNDDDPSIKSVMILPVNFRGISPLGYPEVRMDGLLYLTSVKEGHESPFTEQFGSNNANITGGIADFVGSFVYRLTERLKTFESLRDDLEKIHFS